MMNTSKVLKKSKLWPAAMAVAGTAFSGTTKVFAGTMFAGTAVLLAGTVSAFANSEFAVTKSDEEIGIAKQSFDWNWRFAKFGKFADCLAKVEPGGELGIAKASSSQAHNPEKNAFDGDEKTRWCANGYGQAWLQLDFGRVCDIARTEIVWEQAEDYRYEILHSQDGYNWISVKLPESVPAKMSQEKLGVKARYVRLKMFPQKKSVWPSVCEWRFFDAAGAAIEPKHRFDSHKHPFVENFDDSKWRKLDLPHDWGVESAFLASEPNQTASLPWNAIGWYRKTFDVPVEKLGGNKRIFLNFDGVMMTPQVYVNGEFAGEWKYGYNSFQIEITKLLKAGRNVVAVRAENLPNSTRWYPGAGIYRHVWWVEKNPIHIADNGVFVKTPEITDIRRAPDGNGFVAGTAYVAVETEIRAPWAADYSVEENVLKNGEKIATLTAVTGTTSAVGKLENVELWDIENPALYTLETLVRDGNGKIVDRQLTDFGIREIAWRGNGFYLNGRRVQIKGVCQHQDLGPLGMAVHTRGYERQIEVLKSFGVNAIRVSHNPPAPEFLALCDKMGVLVDAEFGDCWKYTKEGKTNGYNLFWDAWREHDMRNFIKRDRNHPSIICWSIGNEIEEQSKPDGKEIASELIRLCKKFDKTRPTTAGLNDLRSRNNGFGALFDVYGFNYKPAAYADFVAKNPGKPVLGAETGSCVSSRGYYMFPRDDDWQRFWNRNFCDNNLECQVSDYSLYAPGWSYAPDVEWTAHELVPEVAGEFVWTGFDYLGEPTPWNLGRKPANDFRGASAAELAKLEAEFKKIQSQGSPSRSSYFGIVDLCGFWKERAWLYQSHWLPDVPMAHITPHWNWVGQREGKITPVMVFTSGDSAELFLNGKSLGLRKKVANAKLAGRDGKDMFGEIQEHHRLVWRDVKFEAGTLEVVAYKNGKEWARDRVETTGVPANFTLEADRATIAGDGRDLAYVTVTVKDANDRTVPDANNMFEFALAGDCAEIVGVCNGDPTDHLSMKGNKMPAFSGLAQVVVRSKRGESGIATLVATSPDLPTQTLKIEVKKVESEPVK